MAFSGGPRNSTCHAFPNVFNAVLVQLAVTHHVTKTAEEPNGIQPRDDLDELTRGCVGYIDKCMGGTTRGGHHVARVCRKALAIHLEQVAAFQHVEDLGFTMTMKRWSEARRVDCLDRRQRPAGRIRRDADAQAQPDLRNQYRRLLMCRMEKAERHWGDLMSHEHRHYAGSRPVYSAQTGGTANIRRCPWLVEAPRASAAGSSGAPSTIASRLRTHGAPTRMSAPCQQIADDAADKSSDQKCDKGCSSTDLATTVAASRALSLAWP